MGKKYIIEIEDENFHQYSDSKTSEYLWRVKGFNNLVFDEVGLRKLTPYTEPDLEQVREEAYEDGYKTAKVQCNIQAEKDLREVGERHYQKGLSDAWEAARNVIALSTVDRREVFGSEYMYSILEKHTASEAIEKIRQYEQEQEAFHVGDEFVNGNRDKFVIIKMDGEEIDSYIDEYGRTYVMNVKYNKMRKTGRHFPEIAEVLKKMREE